MSRAASDGLTTSPVSQKKWGTIEKDHKTMIRLTNELVAENPIIDAITTATSDITNTHAFANPALLPREYSATAKHIGMDLHQQANLYRYYYVPKQSEINKKIVHGNFRTGFTKKTKFVDKSIFPFAPNHFIRGDQSTSVDNIKLQILEAQYTIVMLTLTLNIMYETIKQNWFNVLLLCVLWLIANEIEHERWVRQHALTGLEEQLQVAERNLQDEQIIISETKEETPQATAKAYGNTIGNMSRSKLELHLPNCQFVHLIAPKNIQIFNSLEEGRSMGLDNCYYCIGDSRR